MAQLMLVNPRPRKAAKAVKPKKKVIKMAVKKRRSAAQKAATAKLIRFNKSRKRAIAAPARKRRRVSAAPLMVRSPIKRRSVAKRPVVRRNPAARRGARRIKQGGGPMGTINRIAKPAITETVGAMGLDVLMGYVNPMLPANLQAGPLNSLIKATSAVGIGLIAERVTKKTTATEMARGALVVTLHGLVRGYVKQFAPNVKLGAYDDGDSYMGEYFTNEPSPMARPSLGMYTSGAPAATMVDVGFAQQYSEINDGWA